jgi:ElaB/YqjD/DUF883 family membrane-anchored ribosome-binding protein
MAKANRQAALAGASAPAEPTLDELQRRAEAARESLAQTVAEIKETVTDKYETVKEEVSDALDWREQYRKHPAEWALAALVIGFAAGYGLAGALGGTKFFAHLRDEAEDFGDRLVKVLADLGDEALARLGNIEHLLTPALVGAVAPVLASQLKGLSGLDLSDMFAKLFAGDGKRAKGKKKKTAKKKGRRKTKADK